MTTPLPAGPDRPPLPLVVTVALTALEAVLFVVLALVEALSLRGEALAMGATTLVFFLAYGGFLGWAAWKLSRLESWARAPVVLAQLIQIFVGASFWGGSTTAVAVAAVLVAVVALAGIFHPASLAALEAGR